MTGEKIYTADQIISMSGIKKGDNLIFVDAKASEKKIGQKLPYLSEITIEKIVPDKLAIKVTESRAIAVISYNGDWWLVDQKARVLDKADEANAAEKYRSAASVPFRLRRV